MDFHEVKIDITIAINGETSKLYRKKDVRLHVERDPVNANYVWARPI